MYNYPHLFLGEEIYMFRFYITAILGCCLFMAQPSLVHAARSTHQTLSRSMLAKKKKKRAIYITVGTAALIAVGIGAGVWAYTTWRNGQQSDTPHPGNAAAQLGASDGTTASTGPYAAAAATGNPERSSAAQEGHATDAASSPEAPGAAQPEPAQAGEPAPHTPKRVTKAGSFSRTNENPTTSPVQGSPSRVRTPPSTSLNPLPPLPESPAPELNDGFLGSTPPHSGAGSSVSPDTKAKYIPNCLLFYLMVFGENYYNKSPAELDSARSPFEEFIRSFQVSPGLTDEEAIEEMRAQYKPLAKQKEQEMRNLFAHTATTPERPLLPPTEQMQPSRLDFGSAAGGGTAGA
jgi:hypothetical protein